jgi:hypothetical protein
VSAFLTKWTNTEPDPLSELKPARSTGEIRGEARPVHVELATSMLSVAGVRIMGLDGQITIGVWSDLNGANIRVALRALDMGHLPVRYLDGASIPVRYKLRRVEGEPVPMSVLAEMERHSAELWKARGPSAGSPH